MIKRYYSNYTGKQIDEAVKTIIDNQIELEDLSPELVAEIKKWIAEGGSSNEKNELVFNHHLEFPSVGNENTLYIAVDENVIYYWKNGRYVAIANAELPEITLINGGGAKENGRN